MKNNPIVELLSHRPGDGVEWHSNKTDLIFLTYILYIEETIKDKYGRPETFKNLVERVCNIVGTPVPKNPHQYVTQARMRKTQPLPPDPLPSEGRGS